MGAVKAEWVVVLVVGGWCGWMCYIQQVIRMRSVKEIGRCEAQECSLQMLGHGVSLGSGMAAGACLRGSVIGHQRKRLKFAISGSHPLPLNDSKMRP